jgi:hypothetical protein
VLPTLNKYSARFNVHYDATREISGPFPIRELKWRERRAPIAPNASYSVILFPMLFAAALFIVPLAAQENSSPARLPVRGNLLATNAVGGCAADIVVVSDAQAQALEQARQILAQSESANDRAALKTAIKEMERSQAALESAKKSPEKLPAAIAAEQAAYQALLKARPREFRIQRSRNGNQGNSSGQPNQRQFDQLEMANEQNRYETERQAAAPPNAQQREQTQVAERLKELAQRQQDLNDRLRELQSALQSARTDQERADIQRQLKRLNDEERQMLANVDELRQQLAQSPNASSQADARQQLDQTRSDMQRAAEELQNQSASSALAAGTRAQQQMQNLREDLRRQTASQFSEQMRQLRNEARDLTRQENEIARGLDSLNNGEHQSLDDSAQRQQVAQQMNQQQSALTNLLAGMRNVTEQAEATEPLLAQKLYDTLRRADQMHTDNLLKMGSQLTERGFLPQASQVERAARTNITELAGSVQRAADSVLGSEAEALRYAQRQLDDLTRQVEREIGGGTNSAALDAGENGGAQNQSNRQARAQGRMSAGNAADNQDTNSTVGANARSSGNESQLAENNSPRQQNGEQNSAAGNQNGNRSGSNQPAANNDPSNPQSGSTPSQRGAQAQNGSNADGGGGGGNRDRLRQFAEQLGRGDLAVDNGGPITGNDFVNWSDQLRAVESVLDPADLRNQLAMVRDRVAAFRGEYRERGRKPLAATVRQQILLPLSQVRVWVQEELARQENVGSLVPLDRDPVPEKYSEQVRQYYEKLGSAQ